MRKSLIVLAVCVFALCACVRRPAGSAAPAYPTSSYSDDADDHDGYGHSGARPSPRGNRASRAIHYATHDKSLPGQVKQLADKVERRFRSGNVSADEFTEWAQEYLVLAAQYAMSTQNLSDSQCESIEYNLGRIAGIIYRDGVVPIMNEVEDINKGLEDYEERSKKWEGAAERGFKHEAGDVDFDFDDEY